MVVYADTSFLVAVYTPQSDSRKALAWMQRATVPVVFTPFHRQELRNAIRLRVYRKEITSVERSAALEEIESDLADSILAHTALPWTDALREAEKLSAAHTENLGTRGADILHVAAALTLEATDFLTFDIRQAALAEAAGLKVKP